MEKIIKTKGKQYLHFPIKNTIGKYPEDKEYHYVDIVIGGKRINTFYIKLSKQFDFYAPYYVGADCEEVTLVCRDELTDDYFDGVLVGDWIDNEPQLYPDLYKEKFRQQFHFSAARGWVNDPNGLFYKDGVFHLYFQHNPLGIFHGGINVSWGHAISTDLVHWKELHDAVYPIFRESFVASGTSFVDEKNSMGYGEGTIFSAHTELRATDYGEIVDRHTQGQFVCISRNEGKTFEPLTQKVGIAVPRGEDWRDPKLFQLDDGRFCIAVYERYEYRNCISFYSSNNMLDWKFESRMMDMYECPDIFRLKVQETGEYKWVLYAADGWYHIGDFKDFQFVNEEASGCLDYGACYAGQTFANYGNEEKKMHLAWINSDEWDKNGKFYYKGKTFSQCLTLVGELTLHRDKNGKLSLHRSPIKAIESLRDKVVYESDDRIEGGKEIPVNPLTEAKIKVKCDGFIGVYVGDAFVFYEKDIKILTTPKGEVAVDLDDLDLDIFIDHTSIEIFVNNRLSLTYPHFGRDTIVRVEAKDAQVSSKLYSLKSIWE